MDKQEKEEFYSSAGFPPLFVTEEDNYKFYTC
jgi:hypothetical protein